MSQTVDNDEDDDATTNLTVFPDEQPRSGEWVDVHDVLENPTEGELEDGRRAGEEIDPDDDDDDGLVV